MAAQITPECKAERSGDIAASASTVDTIIVTVFLIRYT